MGVAKAQRAIADVVQRKQILQSGYDEIVPQAQQATFEETLRGMPALREDERAWLRNHPDSLYQNQHRLRVAFEDSQRKGLERGTEEYFEFLENRVYGNSDSDDAPDNWAPRRQSNGNGSGNGRDTEPKLRKSQVLLTPAQQEHAKAAGVSLEEYAKQVQNLKAAKLQGMYGSQESA
jgi:hypothetical protein